MRPELKYGLLTGVAVGLLLGAGYLLGSHGTRLALGHYGGYFCSLTLLPALYWLFKQKQAQAAGNPVGLAAGIYAGVLASLVAALVICGVLFLYNRYINPFWLDNALDWRVARMRADGIAETEIRREILFFRQAGSPAGIVATTVLGMILVGGLSSIFLVLYLRPRPSAPRP